MKNTFLFTLSFMLLLFSCSNDLEKSIEENLENNNPITDDFRKIVSEKYDGNIFKFGSESEFLKLYDILSKLNQSEFKEFLLIKDGNNSTFYKALFDENIVDANEESINRLEIKDDKLIISEYLSSIFNSENKIIINNETILLNESAQLVSYDRGKAHVIGQINQNSLNSKAFNVNYKKSWVITPKANRRVFLDIFNETIYLNGGITSKLFYRITQQYKSCSFWRCTWKNNNKKATINPNLQMIASCNWPVNGYNDIEEYTAPIFTKLIADYRLVGAPCGAGVVTLLPSSNLIYYAYNQSFTFTDIDYQFEP